MQDYILDVFSHGVEHHASPDFVKCLKSVQVGDFQSVFDLPFSRAILGHDHSDKKRWADTIFESLSSQLSSREDENVIQLYGLLGYASLLSFLQSNFTGPPLPFSSSKLLFGDAVTDDDARLQDYRRSIVAALAVDAVPAYRLTPNIELLCLADTIFSHPTVKKNLAVGPWLQLRTCFVHQQILSEPSSTLQEQIYGLLDQVDHLLGSTSTSADAHAKFLLEKAAIETYYSNDKIARSDIAEATRKRKFRFALTGRLGKKTKFQDREISQLVVLAKSVEGEDETERLSDGSNGTANGLAPQKIDLNDDTLLESISFGKKADPGDGIVDESSLDPVLTKLDPSNQPRMQAVDSIVLLSLASAITNTSPADGLTREETLPYATRVLDNGSSNWQIYTQALLLRSRIEGYKSRTVERGLLQLQALVDQVIAETTGSSDKDSPQDRSTFLPRPKDSESAPASERLRYVFQLAPPPRWELEAELAQRWVQLGGLRSALDIYERLEMWAEAALCWAATEREDKARSVIRRLLYHPTNGEGNEIEDEKWEGPFRDPPPADAPRLLCILGDIDSDPAMYEKAWEVSNQHYARAQRSLGKLFFAKRDYLNAAAAYGKSLNVNKLNHQSWFALGCALLELHEYGRAAESFTRCVQLDETDAEAWSNLAAALLRRDPDDASLKHVVDADDEVNGNKRTIDHLRRSKQDALRALKRAASLKHDSYRIWENVLVVATSLDPPDCTSAIAAQSRIIDLRGGVIGEKCVDVEIMSVLVKLIIASSSGIYDGKPGPERMLIELFDRKVQPLITASSTLWSLVARLAVWRNRPSSALEAHEKAWRVTTSQPAWESDNEARFEAVVDATIDLCDAYESLGPRDATEGLAAGQEGVLVAKDWRFKARSAVRGVMGKAKGNWEGTGGWGRLKDALDGLKV